MKAVRRALARTEGVVLAAKADLALTAAIGILASQRKGYAKGACAAKNRVKIKIQGDAAYTGKVRCNAFKGCGRIGDDTGRHAVSAWGKNLRSRAYYPDGIAIENLFGTVHRVRAKPCTYGIEAALRY